VKGMGASQGRLILKGFKESRNIANWGYGRNGCIAREGFSTHLRPTKCLCECLAAPRSVLWGVPQGGGLYETITKRHYGTSTTLPPVLARPMFAVRPL
jgi:hypothetical protein